MTRTFWRGRRVFITGHTGFKGSWLAVWLEHLGAIVTGYALDAPSQPSLFEVASVSRGMTSIRGDVRDLGALTAALEAAEPEVVLHMAAQSLVRYSYANPVETYSTNVMGTVNLLEAVRGCPSVRAVVVVTSDKCYENREWVWGYRENEPMGGFDPYSNSKGCAELVVSAYRDSFFNPGRFATHRVALASARAGNVIGGGDWALDRLIPDIIRAFSRGEPVVIRNPHSIRPWQHVLEPLDGYLTLAEALVTRGAEVAEAWNFGPAATDARPVQWIVEKLVADWGDGAAWQLDGLEHPHEANYLSLDCSKARARLNWHSKWNLETALMRIVEWHREHLRSADMREVTIKHIEEYQA